MALNETDNVKYVQYLSENKEDIDATIFFGSETYYKCTFLIATIEKEENPNDIRRHLLKHARDILNNVEEGLLKEALDSCLLRDPSRRAVIDALLLYVKSDELPKEYRDERVNECLENVKEYANDKDKHNLWKRKLRTAYADKAFELVQGMLGISNEANDMKLAATFKMIKDKIYGKDPNKYRRDKAAIEGKPNDVRVEEAINRVCTSAYLAEADEIEEMYDLMESLTAGLSNKEEDDDDDDKITELAEKVKSVALLKAKSLEGL